MSKSFYHYLLTLIGPDTTDCITQFANNVSMDSMFPKHSEDELEISTYLEDNSYYISSMDLFDRLWEDYCLNNK